MKEVGNEALKKEVLHDGSLKSDKYRWTIYQSIESILYDKNLDGKQCLLKTICEIAESPFRHHNGLLGEMLEIFFSPSSTNQCVQAGDRNDYILAENFGLNGEPCGEIFKNCHHSLLELFTQNLL